MCYRLLLGRPPEFHGVDQLEVRASQNNLNDLVYGFLRSEEFGRRWETAGFELPEVPVMANLEDFKLWFYLSDRIVGWGAVEGNYESDLVAAIRSFVRPGMLCCDLGANIGYFSMIMAHARAEVFAFEPFPKNFKLLTRNIAENHFDERVRAFPAAVTNHSGTSRLHVDCQESDNVGMFVSEGNGIVDGFRQLEIDTVELDSVVPEGHRVDCIKMDIEGSEPRALAGMKKILMRDKPRIFFEFNPQAIREHSKTDPAELLDDMRRFGYKITTVAGVDFVFTDALHVENLIAA